MNFEEAARLALRMDLVWNGQKMFICERSTEIEPTPMEIGNIEGRINGFLRKFSKEGEGGALLYLYKTRL